MKRRGSAARAQVLCNDPDMPALCRDCLTGFDAGPRCPACRSPRVLDHPELHRLWIAHVDCDAFYASVEKRDNPALRDQPVIVGGGRRGVVTTACYIARIRGVRSAMPMYKALGLCPDAVVVPPRFDAYAAAAQQIRARMDKLSPAVEPVSLDEAFIDLSGTSRLHGAPPVVLLAGLARQIETEVGLTVSVGLSHNKFLAKLASELDKPRGFAVIGQSETATFLHGKPVGMIWGVGAALQAQLHAAGIRNIDDLLRWEQEQLRARFGTMGARLWHLARGQDSRSIRADSPVKSISREITLSEDVADPDVLDGHIWRLSEAVSARAKARALVGGVVTLKLKRTDHSIRTRQAAIAPPSQLADAIYRKCRALFDRSAGAGALRLIGVGLGQLRPAPDDPPASGDLFDPDAGRRAAAERATDLIRARFGTAAIIKGRTLR